MTHVTFPGAPAPLPVARVDSADAAASIVASAAAERTALLPQGGGTSQTYGYVPDRVEEAVVLDLSGMNQVLAHEPGDLTVTVEAGATLDTVQEVLAQHHQFLPLDPAQGDRATIGGILATNAFGPGSAGYGTPRDWLIGITVIDAQGRRVRGGGKVVKNVTGYDLPKLHVGALGTLGVIVEATFKVAPRPDTSRAVLFVLPPRSVAGEAGPAETIIPGLMEGVLRETSPSLALLREDADESRALVLVYSGQEAVVEYETERAGILAQKLGIAPAPTLPPGMRRPFRDPLPHDSAPLIARVAGLPAGAAARHEFLSAMGCWQLIDTLPVTGHADAYLEPDADPLDAAHALSRWAERDRVSVALLHAPDTLRANRDFPLWMPIPSSLSLLRRMKESLDPAGILNPGRFVAGL